jgi:RPA family protein
VWNVWLLKCAKVKNYECKKPLNSTSQQTCDVQVQHEKVEKVMMFKFDLWSVKTKKTTKSKVDSITPFPKIYKLEFNLNSKLKTQKCLLKKHIN